MSATPERCPSCAADLDGGPIPQEMVEQGWYAPGAHWSRVIGREVTGVYDGILYWSCPDCGHAWPRWTDGGRLSLAAAKACAEANGVAA